MEKEQKLEAELEKELEELLKTTDEGKHCTTIIVPKSDIFKSEINEPSKKGRWCGCCYESELESFYGKYNE